MGCLKLQDNFGSKLKIAYSASYVQKTSFKNRWLPAKEENLYLHRDYQQTILAISNTAGKLVEQRRFDAWGNIEEVRHYDRFLFFRKYTTDKTLSTLDRGYTGHEHLQSVGLIHMNGRVYDPSLRRFLGPDNFVQDPFNTQNFNRYGYVLNNPLMYTDPSGEFIFSMLLPGIGAYIDLAIYGAIIGGTIHGITNLVNGNPFFSGMGNAMLMAGIQTLTALTLGMPITSSIPNILFSAAAQFVPPIGINIGNFNLSLSVSAAYGKSLGIGFNFNVGYDDGKFSASYGFGLMSYGNYQGFGTSGLETRNSLMAGYRGKDFGLSLGTNFYNGKGGMGEFSQRTGVLGVSSGDFSMSYENDGTPFQKKWFAGGILGDGGDSYRTAAATIAIGDFSMGLNLFTGNRSTKNQDDENIQKGVNIRDSNNVLHKNSYVNEQGPKYRLGALYMSYGGVRLGADSEHIRHAIQNSFIHRMIGDGEFETTSWNWKSYYQYKTPNNYTSW